MESTLQPKFDTCFFERYAKISLESLLGEHFSMLQNYDRPDLQDNENSIGIEVTRAMREDKNVAHALINDMAGEMVTDVTETEMMDIRTYGYAYGLNSEWIGRIEYDYWKLALPLQRIIDSKVNKVVDGFYGTYREFGLYVFSKENLSSNDVWRTMEFTIDLQKGKSLGYNNLYISQSDEFFVCNLDNREMKRYPISVENRKKYYKQAIISNL